MERLLRISERANIVIHALAYIALNGKDRYVSVKKMSEELKVSETYLAKVLQPLVKEGYLASVRGAKGGFVLDRDPQNITMLELITLVEGALPEHNCLFGEPICWRHNCAFSELNQKLKDFIVEHLKATTLADIMKSFAGVNTAV